MRSDSYAKEASYGGMNDRDLADRAYAGYGGAPARKQGMFAGRKKIWWGLGLLILLAIIGGVVAGILISRNNNDKSSSTSSSSQQNGGNTSNNSGSSTTNGGSSAASGDASFTLDPRLKKSFYALAYTTPNSANYPTCGDRIEDIVTDMQLMSQLTTRLRLYGADCNQSQLVLEAIKRTQVDMQVWLGVYMDSDPTVYDRQIATTLEILREYGADHVAGITVGNEYILGQYTNSPANQATAEALVLRNVADARRQVQALNLGKTIPIGSGDAGSMITATYAAGLDYLFANNHPFFSGVTIQGAAQWTDNYLQTDTPSVALRAANRPTVWQGEVGWPYTAIAGGSLTLNGSAASAANMQIMLDTYLCQANTNSSTTPYVWFEAFDALWKRDLYRGSEAFWGLFDFNKQYKGDITIPDCPAP